MSMENRNDIHELTFVRDLFDEMSETYGLVNLVSSFGFCHRWRRQCVRQVEIPEGCAVVDLMAGMGELSPDIAGRTGSRGSLVSLDISSVMCRNARRYENGALDCSVRVVEDNALCSSLPAESADVVISAFGLKTLRPVEHNALAQEIHRILKPGGTFSLVEISVPNSPWLRVPYMFYLHRVIPLIGRLLKGNPDNYRLLGVYTSLFRNCHETAAAFRRAGLEATVQHLFFGCATGLTGRKSDSDLSETVSTSPARARR